MEKKVKDLLKEWWDLNKKLMIFYWKNHNDTTIDRRGIIEYHDRLLSISEELLPYAMTYFKDFYKYELMLHLLKTNNYTKLDREVESDIKAKLNKICDWLINFTLVALKYRTCIRLVVAVDTLLNNNTLTKEQKDEIYTPEIAEMKANEAFNAIENDNFDDWLSTTTIGDLGYEYNEIIKPFVKKYFNKQLSKISLNEKMVDINTIKNYDHETGSIYTGTERSTHYILGHTNEELIDEMTNINEKVVEKELQKLVGY